MISTFKRFNKWIKRSFPKERDKDKLSYSVAEGLDRVHAERSLDTKLDNLSTAFTDVDISPNQKAATGIKLARHTSDISHRPGIRCRYNNQNWTSEDNFIKIRLEQIRQKNQENVQLRRIQSVDKTGTSPTTGMLKFAKTNSVPCVKQLQPANSVQKPTQKRILRRRGSIDSLVSSDTTSDSYSVSHASEISASACNLDSDRPFPRTPFADRRLIHKIRKRHSMCDVRQAGCYQYKVKTNNFGRFSAGNAQDDPSKMQVVWNDCLKI